MAMYTVQQGDHLSGLAEKFGFLDFHTIWDHARNAKLKSLRINPHVLYPGDQLYIPELHEKTEAIVTTKIHKFRIKRSPLKLRLVLQDYDNLPIANTKCELEIEGEKLPIVSDGDGRIEVDVSKKARTGILRIPELDIEYPVRIGHLDPVDEGCGRLERLANLR